MQERRNKKAADARDTRQYIKIGKLVCKYFPSLLDCRPADGKGESDEIAFFEFLIKFYSNHSDFTHQL